MAPARSPDPGRGARPALLTLAGALAIALVVALLGSAAFGWIFPGAPAPLVHPTPPVAAAPAPAPAAGLIEAVVTAVDGVVEKGRLDGPWSPVVAGDKLFTYDRLRTDFGGRAELAIGEKAQLTVTQSTELQVRALTQTVHQVRLKQGRLVAAYDEQGARVLRIEDARGLAVAEARGARFSVLNNGQSLAVVTETGTVNLAAAGKRVEIGPGQQATSREGEAPSEAAPIPAELLLKIARAQQSVPSVCVELEGTVDPGAELRIDGALVTAGLGGRFSVRVPRREGQASVRVAARDASGRPREQVVGCIPPSVDLKIKLRWDRADAGRL